jgi:cytochrome c-type biogenesis protein CcmH/NrfG
MRHLSAVLVAAHVALFALAWNTLVAPERVVPSRAEPVVATRPSAAPVGSLDSLSLSELETLARAEDSLVLEVQQDSANVEAMAELAHLYMRHGSFEQAVGPLARALEVTPDRDDLWYELLLALKLSGLDQREVDLTARALEFADMARMAGHGC